MITPLGVRQMFQTAHLEAGRVAHEVAGLLGREAAHQKMVDAHLEDGRDDVQMIPKSEGLRTEEKARERERRNARRGGQDQDQDQEQEQGEAEGGTDAPAGSAEKHLDLLA